MNKNLTRIILVTIIIAIVFAVVKFDLLQYLTLDQLKSQQQKLSDFNNNSPWVTALVFFVVYVLVAALSIPGAVILTLAGGAIFGLLKGLIIISFASTIGATLAFLISRFLLRDTIESKFSKYLDKINTGIESDGAFYLFGLRLVPAFPFFVVNLVMGLTRLPVKTFAWVSQLGMLPGTFVFVNAGVQLNSISSLKDITSPGLILSFVLLGVFPIIAKWLLNKLKTIKENKQ